MPFINSIFFVWKCMEAQVQKKCDQTVKIGQMNKLEKITKRFIGQIWQFIHTLIWTWSSTGDFFFQAYLDDSPRQTGHIEKLIRGGDRRGNYSSNDNCLSPEMAPRRTISVKYNFCGKNSSKNLTDSGHCDQKFVEIRKIYYQILLDLSKNFWGILIFEQNIYNASSQSLWK